MKILLVGLVLSAVPCLVQATTKKPTQHSTQPPLKDSFAKSSLRLLKMIDGETGSFDVGADGAIVGPRLVQQAADDLDVDAETQSEQLVSRVLQTFLTARLMHNTSIGAISAKVGLAMSGTAAYSAPTRDLRISQIVAKSPTVLSMQEKESACSTEIETQLRARRFHETAACSSEELAVATPVTLDVSIR